MRLLQSGLLLLLLNPMLYAHPALINPSNESTYAFKTISDIAGDTSSGISIHNTSNTSSLDLTGIYLSDWYFATITGAGVTDCPTVGDAYGELTPGDNEVAALFTSVNIPHTSPQNTITIGANYLYNLIIATAIYTSATQGPNSLPTDLNCFTLKVTTTSPLPGINAPLTPNGSSSNIILTCSNSSFTCTANTPVTINASPS